MVRERAPRAPSVPEFLPNSGSKFACFFSFLTTFLFRLKLFPLSPFFSRTVIVFNFSCSWILVFRLFFVHLAGVDLHLLTFFF